MMTPYQYQYRYQLNHIFWQLDFLTQGTVSERDQSKLIRRLNIYLFHSSLSVGWSELELTTKLRLISTATNKLKFVTGFSSFIPFISHSFFFVINTTWLEMTNGWRTEIFLRLYVTWEAIILQHFLMMQPIWKISK